MCRLHSALHWSNFAAYFTGCQFKEHEKSLKVDFWGRKVDKKSILDLKVDLKSKKSILSIVFST